MNTPWICCQLGAREHYAIPRALHQNQQLAYLITDAWVPPRSRLNHLPNFLVGSLKERFHPDLADATVQDFTNSLLRFELSQRLLRRSDWQLVIARNRWFQKKAARTLRSLKSRLKKLNQPPTIFTYSYAGLEILRYAKSQGWRTILGQIDPGLIEEKIVTEIHQQYPALAPTWKPAPAIYWKNWHQECEIADQILVNSNWSKSALEKAGISPEKTKIVPLAYTPPQAALSFERTYPKTFSAQRKLRVLFLGQVILRKGIAAILEAAHLLRGQPIEFHLIGPLGINISDLMIPNMNWSGSVSRSQVARHYQQADVFLFPTLSDGFGLTQLEAQAWKLPLIVSRFCGEVVKDGVNGIILPEVSGEAIAQTLKGILNSPAKLIELSQNSSRDSNLKLSQLSQLLNQID
ncbi:MAG: glycosyltransferase family 4 protein [Microcoleaceae cyanobacterium]